MTNNTPVAIVTALVAAGVLGLSAAIDQRSTKKVKTREPLSPRLILDLVRQPLWLIAIGANVVGFILQVVALAYGSLALVQPLLVCDLLFAVLIAWYLRQRAGEPQPDMRPIWAGVAITTIGLAGFLAIGQPTPGHTQAKLSMLAPLAIGYVVVVGACLIVSNRNANLRPLALATGCGVSYGVAAFVIKLLTSEFGGGLGAVFTNWPIYVFIVVGPAGFILNQNALQEGTLLAPVQAIISVADPVISIALGIAWLDVRLRSSPAAIAGEIISFLLLTIGIVLTSRMHEVKPAGQKASAGVPGKQQGLRANAADDREPRAAKINSRSVFRTVACSALIRRADSGTSGRRAWTSQRVPPRRLFTAVLAAPGKDRPAGERRARTPPA